MIVFFILEWLLDRIFLIPPAPEPSFYWIPSTCHVYIHASVIVFTRMWFLSFFILFLKVGSHSELSYHQGRTTPTHNLFRVHLSPFVLSMRCRKCHTQMSCLLIDLVDVFSVGAHRQSALALSWGARCDFHVTLSIKELETLPTLDSFSMGLY